MASRLTPQQQAAAETRNYIQEAAEAMSDYISSTDKATQNALQLNRNLAESREIQDQLLEIQIRREQIEENLLGLTDDEKDYAKQILELQENILKERKDSLALTKEDVQLQEQQKKIQADILKLQEKYADEVKGMAGFIGKFDSALQKLPGGGMLSKIFGVSELQKEVEGKLLGAFNEAIASGDGLKGGFKAAGGQLMKMGPAILSVLGPLAAVLAAVMLIKEALAVDQELVDMSRNLGISRKEAEGIHHSMLELSLETDVVGASAKELTKSYEELALAIGQSKAVTKDMAETQVLLTKQFGLTGEEATDFQMTSIASGKTALEMTGQVENMVAAYNQLTGDSINQAQVMQDIAGTSKKVAISYGGFGPALTKAAIQARKMGMSLEDTATAAENLLNIEDSIGKEVKAQVMLGKSFNMDKARALALEGKSAEAAAEAVSQLGMEFDEFKQLSVFKRRAAAEAAGLTEEQLITALELEKIQKTLGNDQVKSMKDLTAEQLKQLEVAGAIDKTRAEQLAKENQQASTQEKLALLQEKLMSVLAKIAEPILPALEAISEALTDIMPLIKILGKILQQFVVTSLESSMVLLRPIINLFSGLADILNEDVSKGFEKVGKTILQLLVLPIDVVIQGLNAITALIPGIPRIPTFSKMIEGMGGAEGAAPEGLYRGGTVTGTGAVMVGEKGPELLNLPAGSTVSNNTNTNTMLSTLREQNELLRSILSNMAQPVNLTIGNKSIREIDSVISLNRNYTARIGNTYGATV